MNAGRVATHLLLAALLAVLLPGCTSTSSTEIDPHPVRFERVTGAGGEHLGWVRTDLASDSGRTYEIVYDRDMKPVGYTALPGQHYVPGNTNPGNDPTERELEYLGSFERRQGLGKVYGQRTFDVNVEELSHRELTRAGPLSGASDSVSLGGDETGDDADDEDEE